MSKLQLSEFEPGSLRLELEHNAMWVLKGISGNHNIMPYYVIIKHESHGFI